MKGERAGSGRSEEERSLGEERLACEEAAMRGEGAAARGGHQQVEGQQRGELGSWAVPKWRAGTERKNRKRRPRGVGGAGDALLRARCSKGGGVKELGKCEESGSSAAAGSEGEALHAAASEAERRSRWQLKEDPRKKKRAVRKEEAAGGSDAAGRHGGEEGGARRSTKRGKESELEARAA